MKLLIKTFLNCIPDKTDIIVIVKSHYRNRDNRDAIRGTWGGYVKQGQWLHGETLNYNIKVAFLLGETGNPGEKLIYL